MSINRSIDLILQKLESSVEKDKQTLAQAESEYRNEVCCLQTHNFFRRNARHFISASSLVIGLALITAGFLILHSYSVPNNDDNDSNLDLSMTAKLEIYGCAIAGSFTIVFAVVCWCSAYLANNPWFTEFEIPDFNEKEKELSDQFNVEQVEKLAIVITRMVDLMDPHSDVDRSRKYRHFFPSGLSTTNSEDTFKARIKHIATTLKFERVINVLNEFKVFYSDYYQSYADSKTPSKRPITSVSVALADCMSFCSDENTQLLGPSKQGAVRMS